MGCIAVYDKMKRDASLLNLCSIVVEMKARMCRIKIRISDPLSSEESLRTGTHPKILFISTECANRETRTTILVGWLFIGQDDNGFTEIIALLDVQHELRGIVQALHDRLGVLDLALRDLRRDSGVEFVHVLLLVVHYDEAPDCEPLRENLRYVLHKISTAAPGEWDERT